MTHFTDVYMHHKTSMYERFSFLPCISCACPQIPLINNSRYCFTRNTKFKLSFFCHVYFGGGMAFSIYLSHSSDPSLSIPAHTNFVQNISCTNFVSCMIDLSSCYVTFMCPIMITFKQCGLAMPYGIIYLGPSLDQAMAWQKFKWKFTYFQSRKLFWKCLLKNGHFVPASLC